MQRFPLQVGKLLQQFLRTVEMESQQFPVLLYAWTNCSSSSRRFCSPSGWPNKSLMAALSLWKPMIFTVNGIHRGKIARVGSAFCKILPEIPAARPVAGVHSDPPGPARSGAYTDQVQQFPDTGRRLFPGDEGGAGTLGAFALGNADSFGVVPDGILSAIQIKASAVLSIVLCQEPGIVRLILFEIGADDEAAVLVVSTNAQRLVDYLLRQSMGEENGWLGRTLGLGWLAENAAKSKRDICWLSWVGSCGCPSE